MSNKQSSINVGGLQFDWDLEEGLFQFEGEAAVLFWIESAMGAFIDTIEEISGEDSSNIVMETTGYQQGLVVGEYFKKMKDVTVLEALQMISNTYASAGWGKFTVKDLDLANKKLTIDIKDSWEYKILRSRGKTHRGYLLPAHFAGILTELFNTNIWVEVDHYQIQGNASTVANYFPSDSTVTDNIHRLTRKKEMEEITKLETLVQDKTKELEDLVTKLSSPIIPVLEGIVVIPLLGKYDEKRVEELIEKTLENIPNYEADYLVLDLTGLDKDVNESTVTLVERISTAVSLLGMKIILVGVSPELSQIIVRRGVHVTGVNYFHSLQHGIYHALGEMGRSII